MSPFLLPTQAPGEELKKAPKTKTGKLAELVSNQTPRKGASYSLMSPPGQGVKAQIEIKGTQYAVWVSRERTDLTVAIEIWRAGADSSEIITLSGSGLDGKVHGAGIPAKFSPTGQDLVFEDRPAFGQLTKGLAHQKQVQKAYDNALKTLLKFYRAE